MLAHRLQTDMLEPVDERPHMLSTDLTSKCGFGDQRQVTQDDHVTDQGGGLTGVHPQLVAHPGVQRRGAVELEVLGRLQLGQQGGLGGIDRVLHSLQGVDLVPHVTGSERARSGAHRVNHSPRIHTPILVEHLFDHKR